MILSEILIPGEPVENIMIRTNAPPSMAGEPDILFGYCAWDGEELISLDGDYYSLDWEVERYEWAEDDMLVCWIHVGWEGG